MQEAWEREKKWQSKSEELQKSRLAGNTIIYTSLSQTVQWPTKFEKSYTLHPVSLFRGSQGTPVFYELSDVL